MKAIVTQGTELQLATDLPQPTPSAGQVLVKTRACGICGSDLHALAFGARMVDLVRRSGGGLAWDPAAPLVFGHEFAAEVVEFGADTPSERKAGELVVSMPIVFGAAGLETVGYSNQFPGGFGEYMVLQEELLLPVPNGLSAEHAAMTEPMAVGLHAVEAATLTSEHVAMVLGAGPIGLAVLLALKAKGFGPVIVAEPSAPRRALAEKLGADIVLDPNEASPHEQWASYGVPTNALERLMKEMAGESFREPVIFECVGVPGMLQQILEGCPVGARIIVVGVCMEADKIEPALGINKHAELRFVLGYAREEFAETLRGIAEGKWDVAPLHTESVGLDGVAGAFERLQTAGDAVKILVCPHH